MSNTLITILARSGSKGLPNKNILPMHGKPLIEWTAGQAKASELGSIVYCVDPELLPKFNGWGSDWICARPKELSADNTPKLDVIRYALKSMESNTGYPPVLKNMRFDTIIDLDVCNPLRKVEDIQAAYELFLKGNFDTLFSVTPARKNPYMNQVMPYGKTHWQPMAAICDEEGLSYREPLYRQDAPEVYDVNCSIYVYKRDWLMDESHKSPISDNSGIYLMEPWQAYDIDSQNDWDIVELMMEKHGIAK